MKRLTALLLAGACLLAAGCRRDAAVASSSAPADTGLLARIAQQPDSGALHLVRLAVRGDTFAFEPQEVHARPGDVVRFVLAHPEPESVAFDTASADPAVRRYLVDHGLARGPLLTATGQVYEARFPDAPPGRYPFFSVAHAERGMRGVVVIE